ncbi:PEP-CTERM sorting domain-containing protein [bacterium]|nr:PEP-CTERM sorting domain-containing protein [bacterium]
MGVVTPAEPTYGGKLGPDYAGTVFQGRLSYVNSIDDNGIIYGTAKPAYDLDRRHWTWAGEPYHVALVPRGMAPPFDVAPAPVPEPSTWLIGVGMIAAAAWKHRRQGRS